jgi:hypothetical protein
MGIIDILISIRLLKGENTEGVNEIMNIQSNSAFGKYRPQIGLIGLIFTDFLSENQKKSVKISPISLICGLFGSYAELLYKLQTNN